MITKETEENLNKALNTMAKAIEVLPGISNIDTANEALKAMLFSLGVMEKEGRVKEFLSNMVEYYCLLSVIHARGLLNKDEKSLVE